MELQKATANQLAQQNLPLTLLPIFNSVTLEERRVLEVKYSMPRVSALSATDLPLHAKAVLIRIHAITGWTIPEDELIYNTLVSEFQNYLTEQCSDMNIDEVSYAVRTYGLQVKDWGKSMNLSLIDQPISAYRAKRAELSALEERAAQANTEALPAQTEGDWSECWEDIKLAAKAGTMHRMIIPVAVYDWLVRKEMLQLTAEDKKTLYKQSIEGFIKKCTDEMAMRRLSQDDRADLRKLTEADWENKYTDLKIRMTNLAKVQAVKELAMSEVI